ncbi:hypothetical protein [Bifidobacterium sp. SO1]|uniref:hypothetical protein n=1 Tax=Bifidobacterium sp. SO1 TaxID=2809029 RepID=UPI001BDD5C8F|nr:hypothetical protein [Bifidobacterium sp. SO1]MBT1162550.1 hypothetical protein [Bifidobacterium sp. SO1]
MSNTLWIRPVTNFKPSKKTLALINDQRNYNPEIWTTVPLDGRVPIPRKTAGWKTGWQSYLGLQHQVRSDWQVEELRLEYRKFYDEQIEYTGANPRRAFLNADHEVDNGVLEYTVEGQVVDYRSNGLENDRIARICLMFPHVINKDGSRTPIDSHIWLGCYRKNVRVEPGLIEPHNQRGRRLLTIGIGDTLRIRAQLVAYTDKRGIKRFGLNDWMPLDSRLHYYQRQADGTMVHRVVESRLDRGLMLGGVDDRGVFFTRITHNLDQEMTDAANRHLDMVDHAFLTDDTNNGWPTVCRTQYRVISQRTGICRTVVR